MFSQSEITDLVRQRDWRTIRNLLSDWLPADIADLLNNLDEEQSVIVFRLLPRERAAASFAQVTSTRQQFILEHVVDREIRNLVSELSPDDRTELLEELPGQLTQRVLNLISSPEERKEALELLGYPEGSVGRLMTPDYVAVRPEWSVGEAMEHIRRYGRDAETIDMVYVTDSTWKMVDDIPIRRFILTDTSQPVTDIMDEKFIAVGASVDWEEAYRTMKKYDLNVLPVVDSQGILIGITTIDDILDVLEEETTEDFQKTAAVVPVERSYSAASPFLLYRKRVIWLMLLLVADFLSSSVIAHYENMLQVVIALAFFIPVLIDSGGNVASQSSTLIIRAIAVGELSLKKWVDVVKKELLIGLMLGITLGAILYLRSLFWQGGSQVALILGLSMVCVIVWANILGSVLPIVLDRFKLDPAIISTPLLTTIVDSTGLLIYFAFAQLILHVA